MQSNQRGPSHLKVDVLSNLDTKSVYTHITGHSLSSVRSSVVDRRASNDRKGPSQLSQYSDAMSQRSGSQPRYRKPNKSSFSKDASEFVCFSNS